MLSASCRHLSSMSLINCVILRCRCNQPTNCFVSSCIKNTPASCTNVADIIKRDVGVSFAFPACNQSGAVVTTCCQRRCRRSTLRAGFISSLRSLAFGLRQVLSITFALENFSRIMRQLASPNRTC